MVPRDERGAHRTCSSCPLGDDGFFNEIHPKLRPVETVVDGVLIAGHLPGAEDLAPRAWPPAWRPSPRAPPILKKGFAELDPLVAVGRRRRLHRLRRVPRRLPVRRHPMADHGDGRTSPLISATVCKGCGGCVPVCPEDAIDLLGYTDAQIRAMIDSLVEVPVA